MSNAEYEFKEFERLKELEHNPNESVEELWEDIYRDTAAFIGIVKGDGEIEDEFHVEDCPFYKPEIGPDCCGDCTVLECPEYELASRRIHGPDHKSAFKQHRGRDEYHHTIMPADLGLSPTIDTDDPNWRKNLFPKGI